MANAESDKATEDTAVPPAAGRARWLRLPGSRLLAPAGIVLALAAILFAGFAGQRAGRVENDLAAVRDSLQSGIDDAAADLGAHADAIESIERAIARGAATDTEIAEDLATVSVELRAQARRIEALQGGRLDARDSWLREQAEYYLVLAGTELGLRRDVDRAGSALELADDVLLELADPRLGDVRRAIASELQALRAVPRPDVEGLAHELGGLIERVPDLPMRAANPANFGSAEDAAAGDEAGLARLWSQTKGAVTSIVRIERQDGPVEVVLSEAERRLVRRQLALELQIARAAAIERRAADFRASLLAADTLLDRDFDRDQRAVIAARELLERLRTIELEPPLPDVGDSLVLFRSAAGDR